MNVSELEQLMQTLGQPMYRAGQVFEWLHKRGASTFLAMNNIPKELRTTLESLCYITPATIVETLSAKDGTVKHLIALGTNADIHIESVVMEYAHGRSVCVSTQAGCRMGCLFCATSQGGLIRNLTAGEICMQVYAAGGARNVVLMGCGEPLDNFDAVMRFIELITHPKGAGLSQRHITLSTCGLTPQIYELAKRKMQITLAISLHGANDATRQALMPIAKRYPIQELLTACRQYTNTTHRRITFEYALTQGVNDSPSQARELARLLKGMLCHVNLIPVNPGETHTFSPTNRRGAEAFAAILEKSGIPATVRRTIGAEVNAACGQLRAKKEIK